MDGHEGLTGQTVALRPQAFALADDRLLCRRGLLRRRSASGSGMSRSAISSCSGETTRISLSMLMLASLLLNAGLGVQWDKMREMLRSPKLLGAGLAANLLIPIAFILVRHAGDGGLAQRR